MLTILEKLFRQVVQEGLLEIEDARGRSYSFGPGGTPRVGIRLMDTGAEWALLRDPALTLGELYMDGRLRLEQGNVYDLLSLLHRGACNENLPWFLQPLSRLRFMTRRLRQANSLRRAEQNVRHHYDIDLPTYDLFLDRDRQYSCAYFRPGDDIESAQQAKMRHLAAKLDIGSGQSVLDIGCGWGGLGAFLAQNTDADVVGITLSDSQVEAARKLAREQGLRNRLEFIRQDYRMLQGTFDRIVSVGMFEHVGIDNYPTYFKQIKKLLKPGGRALIHTIGRSDGPGFTNPFISRYISPGGYFPALSEMMPVIEQSGLITCDIEVLRLHYAKTLRAWRERFVANWDEAARRHDERFCRMWEFYLAGAEMGFRHHGLVVFQILVAHDVESVPITRDFIAEREAELEWSAMPPLPVRIAGE